VHRIRGHAEAQTRTTLETRTTITTAYNVTQIYRITILNTSISSISFPIFTKEKIDDAQDSCTLEA
jgi:hypothetical protein